MSASSYRFVPFEPSDAGYRALAELSCRVSPRQPTCAAWLARSDETRGSDDSFCREVVIAGDGATGFAGMMEWSRHRWLSDRSRYQLSIEVDPARRSRGIGGSLYRRAIARAPEGQRIAVECSTSESDSASVGFLVRRGFYRILRVPQSELELGAFDPRAFESEVQRVEASGIAVVTLAGRCADVGLLRRIHDLQATTTRDAPGMASHRLVPFEVWRRSYAGNPDLVPDLHVVAIDGDEVVGMTQVWASQATDEILYTGFTGVARSHRRRGIAMAVKTRSLGNARRLRTSTGGAPVVRTGNEESNPMLAIDRRLGFVELPAVLLFELDIVPPRAA